MTVSEFQAVSNGCCTLTDVVPWLTDAVPQQMLFRDWQMLYFNRCWTLNDRCCTLTDRCCTPTGAVPWLTGAVPWQMNKRSGRGKLHAMSSCHLFQCWYLEKPGFPLQIKVLACKSKRCGLIGEGVPSRGVLRRQKTLGISNKLSASCLRIEVWTLSCCSCRILACLLPPLPTVGGTDSNPPEPSAPNKPFLL